MSHSERTGPEQTRPGHADSLTQYMFNWNIGKHAESFGKTLLCSSIIMCRDMGNDPGRTMGQTGTRIAKFIVLLLEPSAAGFRTVIGVPQ